MATRDTSKPEVLGEEDFQNFTDLGVLLASLEVDQTSWCAVTKVFLHQASYAHTALGTFEEQKPVVENTTPGSPLRFDPVERRSEGQEEGGIHIR